jgi:hypothetical protein
MLDFLILGCLSLDTHYFFDGISDIKLLYILSEFASFDLSEIQQILDQEIH